VRTGGATHPRLRILGAIEARLVRADRLILAGLEEGVWPRGAPIDPFLSRPMRARLGLPPPERRIGLTAHDFAQAACAPEVVLLHSRAARRRAGRESPLAVAAEDPGPGREPDPDRASRRAGLGPRPRRPGPYAPIARPAPTPPVADRPRKMAVTRVEALTRDPYAVWARDILKLYPLDRPDEPVEARARGTAIHAAFETFAARPSRPDPADPLSPGLTASSWSRPACRPPPWPANGPWPARPRCGSPTGDPPPGRRPPHRRRGGRRADPRHRRPPFTVTAKADRIEPTPDGLAHILDYKTGAAPSKKQVETGFSPQLTLTAAILREGGFAEVGRREPRRPDLSAGHRPQAGRCEEVRARGGDSLKRRPIKALNGLASWSSATTTRPSLPSRTAPQFVNDHAGDYGHLARVFEWSTSGEGRTNDRLFPSRPAAHRRRPGLSAFVTANAGSGKTKTLIDRVARLLLAGRRPRRSSASPTPRPPPPRCSAGCSSGWASGRSPPTRPARTLGALEGRDADRFDHGRPVRARACSPAPWRRRAA
jgi:ATP-dependent helicase/nuclease subunit B